MSQTKCMNNLLLSLIKAIVFQMGGCYYLVQYGKIPCHIGSISTLYSLEVCKVQQMLDDLERNIKAGKNCLRKP